MTQIVIAGLDGSKTNFGIARMLFDTETQALAVQDLVLLKTEKSTNKKVRASSDNLERAQIIARGIVPAIAGATICFAEVPSGGQSYDAVLGFGIVIGLYASITVPMLEVSPRETKKATVGSGTASKQEMIEWAATTYPTAPWRTVKRGGVLVPTLDNEHLADACAIVHAGIQTPAFRQLIAIYNTKVAA